VQHAYRGVLCLKVFHCLRVSYHAEVGSSSS
jgi:hypothetical protein